MGVLTFALGSGGAVELEVESVAVGAARADIPGLMRRSAETGRGFLIKNAKTQAGPSAILVDLAVFRDRMAQVRPSRTLGEIVDSLPFHKLGKSPVLEPEVLPNDTLPALDMPDASPAGPATKAQGRR